MEQQLGRPNSTKTREEIMADVVGQQEARKAQLKKLQEKAALGGPEGREGLRRNCKKSSLKLQKGLVCKRHERCLQGNDGTRI